MHLTCVPNWCSVCNKHKSTWNIKVEVKSAGSESHFVPGTLSSSFLQLVFLGNMIRLSLYDDVIAGWQT